MNELFNIDDMIYNIFEFSGIYELKYINKKIELIRKEKIKNSSLIINKYIYNFIKAKFNIPVNNVKDLRIYTKKYFPYKLREASIVFYISNIHRYQVDNISEELFNTINFIIFIMNDISINIRFSQLIDILDNNQFYNFYESILKFKIIYDNNRK